MDYYKQTPIFPKLLLNLVTQLSTLLVIHE